MSEKPIFAFVLMPFDVSFDDVYEIGIKEAAEAEGIGIRAERLDEQIYMEGMIERIYRQIEAANIIIADLSSKNPNVFYELGYAHAKDKICILITKNAEDIPFDLKHRRHIVYGDSLTYLRDELTRNLLWAKSEIQNIRTSNIRVELTPSGSLETTENEAEATVDFKIDFFNDTEKPSPEIYSIYLYLNKDWGFKQDGRTCAVTASDIPSKNYRYFLNPPVDRLHANSWAQINLTGGRTVAAKWRGENIEDSYNFHGTSLLRLGTSKGTFDYELKINVKVETFPF